MNQPLRTEIKTDGHTLHALTFNPGAPGFPILLLHGVMSSLPFWTEDLLEPFLPYGPCTALTLPGHYPATFPPDFAPSDLTAERMAALVHEGLRQSLLAQGLDETTPALITGHSTGGFAALSTAVHYQRAVRGVVSVAGFAQGRWGGWLSLYQKLARRDRLGLAALRGLVQMGSNRSFFYGSAAYHTPIPRGTRTPAQMEALIEDNYQVFRNFDPRSMQIYFAAMRDVDILARLGSIRVPVLALCGDSDPAVPPVQSARIAQAVPGAHLAILPGGVGHMPFYQQPEAYRAVLDPWLRENFGSLPTR